MLTAWTDAQVLDYGKPSQNSWCAVVVDDGTQNGKLIFDEHVGSVTVPVAEYTAVIKALEWAQSFNTPIHIITDAAIVANQVHNKCETKATHLVVLRDKVRYLLGVTGSTLVWQARDTNKAGMYYERKLAAR